MGGVSKLAEWFLHPSLRARDIDDGRRARLALSLLGASTLAGCLLAAARIWHGYPTPFIGPGLLTATAAVVIFRLTGSLKFMGHLLSGVWWLVVLGLAALGGGLQASPIIAIAFTPLIAMFLLGWRGSLGWTVASCGSVVGFKLLETHGMLPPSDEANRTLPAVAAFLLSLAMFGIAYSYESIRTQALDAARLKQEEAQEAERKRARAEAEAQLEKADRMSSLGMLAAGIAHEINNPLTYVLTNLAYIREEIESVQSSEGAATDALGDVEVAVERIRRIVTDLKTFVRPEDETIARLQLSEVVQSAIKLAANEINHRATLVEQYSTAPPVDAAESRLVQVLLNLLVNAAQAIPEGAVSENQIRVTVAPRDDDSVMVEVQDTGSGIDPETLSKITEPFFTTKPVGVGTGLGLSVCANIIRQLGGTLEFDSEVGRGTTARVVLPAADPDAHTSLKPVPSAVPTPTGKARVLVVDDDPLVRRALRRILSAHELVEAESGRSALERLAEDDAYDLILCDLMMPDLTGADVYDELSRERAELLDRFVFMTGGAFTERPRELIGHVDTPVLEKPFDVAAIRKLVAEALDRPPDHS